MDDEIEKRNVPNEFDKFMVKMISESDKWIQEDNDRIARLINQYFAKEVFPQDTSKGITNFLREKYEKRFGGEVTDEQLAKAVSQLSGGQQQRVAIARALVNSPSIICMDEPLSNLDAKLRVELRNELKKMQKDFGITTIYVTHDQEEALTLSDRIAVFNKGVIEQIGTPNEIYNHSATEFVCNFIGDINPIGKKLSAKLSSFNSSVPADGKNYIRLERLHIEDKANPKFLQIKGTVVRQEYYGLYVKYYIEAETVDLNTDKVISWNLCFLVLKN